MKEGRKERTPATRDPKETIDPGQETTFTVDNAERSSTAANWYRKDGQLVG